MFEGRPVTVVIPAYNEEKLLGRVLETPGPDKRGPDPAEVALALKLRERGLRSRRRRK